MIAVHPKRNNLIPVGPDGGWTNLETHDILQPWYRDSILEMKACFWLDKK
jgi:hypothetical protein